MRPVVPAHVDVAIVRAADVAYEVVTVLLKSPTAKLAVRS